MNRRTFLTGAASGAAAVVGLTATGIGQGQAPASPQPAGAAQAGGRGGRGRRPRERIGSKTGAHRHHDAERQQHHQAAVAGGDAGADARHLRPPEYYVDGYGVRNVEFQSNHIAQNADTPDLGTAKS